jgi:catechol 2,3-dioxygenase-like lactoylglutathione lyase family enzyme
MRFQSQAKILIITLLALCSGSIVAQSPKVSVESVGMTVSDMDRAVEFYSALTFQKVSDVEVLGEDFEHLEGVFGARTRTRYDTMRFRALDKNARNAERSFRVKSMQ